MSTILHHLEALGWAWVSLFAALALIALACAIVAIVSRRRRIALTALFVSGGVTLATPMVGGAATGVGLTSAFAASGTVDPSQKARVLAEGISEAMNGAALGVVAMVFAALATVVCLVAFLAYRSQAQPTAAPDRER
jgi:hypothetical protein